MNMHRVVLAGFVTFILTLPSAAQRLPAAEPEPIVIDDLSPTQLRAEIEKIQDEFYKVFNTLNEDDAFDVVCQKFTPTGSNIPRTGCEPRFVSKRRGDNANDYRQGTDELLSSDELTKELQPQFEQLTAKMNEALKNDKYFQELSDILKMLRGRLVEIGQ